jgi:hypothetical protein
MTSISCRQMPDGLLRHHGSTAALAPTLTLATVANCVGIGFRRGTHMRGDGF